MKSIVRKYLKLFSAPILFGYFGFLAGGIFMMWSWWPMDSVATVYRYLFLEAPNLTVMEKLKNDLGIAPYRNLAQVQYQIRDPSSYSEVTIPSAPASRTKPLVFVNEKRRRPSLTMVAGLMDTEDGLHGALLFSSSGELLHHWIFETKTANGGPPLPSPYRKTLHGMAVLPDASIIVSFHGENALSRYDACGNLLWRVPIATHHSVTPAEIGYVWTIADYATLTKVNVQNGEIVDEIPIEALAASAPGKWILTGRKDVDIGGSAAFMSDPFHVNDVEALSPEMADAFPMFRAGDLLVSHRSGNVIYVVRPETREILWWMTDGKYAQHDPDWRPDGTIVFFDNNTGFGSSRIVRIDPETNAHELVVDGEDMGFYSPTMGNQEMRADGSVLVVSTHQGRAVEFDPAGHMTFEFVNIRNSETNERGIVTEARILPLSFVNAIPDCN